MQHNSPKGAGPPKDQPYFFDSTNMFFKYRVTISRGGKMESFILDTVQQVILNTHVCSMSDTITYIERTNGRELRTISFIVFLETVRAAFKAMDYPQLELAYFNLRLNNIRKYIVDLGRMNQIDDALNTWIFKENQHLVEFHISFDQRTNLFLKVRSGSLLILKAAISHIYNSCLLDSITITIPQTVQRNYSIFREILAMDIGCRIKIRVRPFKDEEALPNTNYKRLSALVLNAIQMITKTSKAKK